MSILKVGSDVNDFYLVKMDFLFNNLKIIILTSSINGTDKIIKTQSEYSKNFKLYPLIKKYPITNDIGITT